MSRAAAERTRLLTGTTAPGSLTLFRYTDYDVPFWARPNTRAGRWHVVGEPATQYWSMTPSAAWAELIRAEHLHSESDLDLVRMPLWVCRVPVARLVELRRSEHRARAGLTEHDLIADDWHACQAAAARIRLQGTGVIAPCAALEGHANVTIFGARRQIDWRARPALASAVPAAVVAIGRPPVGLLPAVRRRDDSTGSPRPSGASLDALSARPPGT